MTRFPLKLKVKIRRAQLARMLRQRSGAGAVVSRVELLRAGANAEEWEPKSEEEVLAEVARSTARVIWIGGVEPMLHPACGKLARELTADKMRTIFVETDGRFLRRRIHEFRPVNELYLTVRFAAGGEFWSLGMEGLRAAKLSGFLVCAHLPVNLESELAEVVSLREKLRTLDVDGIIVTGEPIEKVEAVWSAVGDRKWLEFSREVEDALRGETVTDRNILQTPRELEPEEETDSREAGVPVS